MTIHPGMRIHFMGIGGIGMSALAELCLARGVSVHGCDVKLNGTSHQLKAHGASVALGHHPTHCHEGTDLLVYSAAVPAREPELLEARTCGIPTMTRGELLAALAKDKRLIGVAGAHGKTTTSGMAAQLLVEAGWDPSVAVGGLLHGWGTNARPGGGVYLVAETDESDGSFLLLSPEIAIVTNLDREHLNYYHSFERLVEAFRQFVDQLRPGGVLIRCVDDPVIRATVTAPRQLNYGFEAEADVTARSVELTSFGSTCRVFYKGRPLGRVSLQVPGRHNILNALAVISLGLTLDLSLSTIREALASFRGTARRFQMSRLPGDLWFVEDYAHHPSEIQATLSAEVSMGRRRLVVFQPHRFSRTQSLEREFSSCFTHADGVIVTDIYPAFEAPIPGVSGERLVELIKAHGHPCARYVPKPELPSFITRMARPGDTVFFLGAGDIGELCHDLAARVRTSARTAR